ncbi:MAG: hypothetical protein HYX39_00615 [Bacteroidetes bacterium]|nr:hypothetical protein [Bacteroidota bacterium]
MKLKFKIAAVITAIALICSHFLFLFFYSFKSNKFSFFYTYPYFHQNWNLFVPAPQSNYNLYAFYESDKGLQKTDLFQHLLIKHQSNRFSGTEPFLIALSNCIHYVEAGSVPGLSSDYNFKMIEKFAGSYLQHTCTIKSKKVKLILVVSNPKYPSPRIYYN